MTQRSGRSANSYKVQRLGPIPRCRTIKKMKPKFDHNCDSCKYLGSDDEHDFYHCQSTIETVIARYGDNPPDYISGLLLAKNLMASQPNHPLAKAYKLAKLTD